MNMPEFTQKDYSKLVKEYRSRIVIGMVDAIDEGKDPLACFTDRYSLTERRKNILKVMKCPLKEIPLFINIKDDAVLALVHWRLQIGR